MEEVEVIMVHLLPQPEQVVMQLQLAHKDLMVEMLHLT